MRSSPAARSALDRQRFGIETARWQGAGRDGVLAALDYCRAHAVELLLARCDASDVAAAHALEEAGGRLMDTLVSYERNLEGRADGPLEPQPEGFSIRRAGPSDADAVHAIAAEAFRNYPGHYHADPRLAREQVAQVYPDWARRSCLSDELALAVLLAEGPEGPCGFLTLRGGEDGELEIALNGVTPEAQGRGVYAALLRAALTWCREQGGRRIRVSTQLCNLTVQRAWLRAGFAPLAALHTFHVWLRRV